MQNHTHKKSSAAAGLARGGGKCLPVHHAHPVLLVLLLGEGQAKPARIRRALWQVLAGACVVTPEKKYDPVD